MRQGRTRQVKSKWTEVTSWQSSVVVLTVEWQDKVSASSGSEHQVICCVTKGPSVVKQTTMKHNNSPSCFFPSVTFKLLNINIHSVSGDFRKKCSTGTNNSIHVSTETDWIVSHVREGLSWDIQAVSTALSLLLLGTFQWILLFLLLEL